MQLALYKKFLHPIHPQGWPFVAVFAVAAFFLAKWNVHLGWVGALLTLWCAFFFRDPKRQVPQDQNLAVSPADGLVEMIAMAAPPREMELGDTLRPRISIFMSVFDVHINRAPMNCTVAKQIYKPGKFLSAELEKASDENERNSLLCSLPDGNNLVVVQIAGLVARRIKSFVKEGDVLEAGSRIGLIRFGSRVDVYLPEGAAPLVCVGQKAIAGETVLADLGAAKTAPRQALAI
ncbi:MAG: phosphatidylserine decarboxylase [Dongiaceae bacterium]